MPLIAPSALPANIDVFLVEEQANPSTDYFVLPACSGDGRRVHHCRFDELPPPQALAGALVVFVRYLPTPWRRLIEAVRPQLAGLVFFMDDDILETKPAAGMPWRYRYKLYRLATRHRGWLAQQRATLWVATPWLAKKYAALAPQLVEPQPLTLPASRTPSEGMCRVFYHGSASHDAEIRWLHPVMQEVLRRDARVVFEIVGGQSVYRLYRNLPRVTVVHPMKWPAYQAFMDQPGRQIGLVPLLDLPFNRARSATKCFDVTRCGAAGLYAEGSPHAAFVRDGVDGLVLPMQPEAWVREILMLVADAPRRAKLAAAAQQRLQARR